MGKYTDDKGYDRYDYDDGYYNKEEADRAVENGDAKRLFDGRIWDPDTDTVYDENGRPW